MGNNKNSVIRIIVTNELTINECSCGQEVFLVIGESLQQNAIAARVIPSAMMDQVWHNGLVYKGN